MNTPNDTPQPPAPHRILSAEAFAQYNIELIKYKALVIALKRMLNDNTSITIPVKVLADIIDTKPEFHVQEIPCSQLEIVKSGYIISHVTLVEPTDTQCATYPC